LCPHGEREESFVVFTSGKNNFCWLPSGSVWIMTRSVDSPRSIGGQSAVDVSTHFQNCIDSVLLPNFCLWTVREHDADSPRLTFLHTLLADFWEYDFQFNPDCHCTSSGWLYLFSTMILTWIPIQTTRSCQIQTIAFAYEQKYLYIANLINQSSNKFAIYQQKVKTSMNQVMNSK
jgi:hypothetical protein